MQYRTGGEIIMPSNWELLDVHWGFNDRVVRSKTDAAGEGAQAYLSHETVKWLEKWLHSAGIEERAIFRRLIGQHRVGERLRADIIADIYKRVARWVGMPAKQVDQVSGHSVRVGVTQDLLSLNIDLASIMQSGRWKSSRMPMRYGEEILAARGGMARAAASQGRDSRQADPKLSEVPFSRGPFLGAIYMALSCGSVPTRISVGCSAYVFTRQRRTSMSNAVTSPKPSSSLR